MSNEVIAHSANESGVRHALDDHLRSVAALAKEFAGEFGGGELAFWLGMWHDIGKSTCAFQGYLADCERGVQAQKVDHKTAGTAHALDSGFGPFALCVEGHHGGLEAVASLKDRVANAKMLRGGLIDEALEKAGAAGLLGGDQQWRAAIGSVPERVRRDRFASELFVRMVFSALVDADFLDTEKHFQGGRDRAERLDPAAAMAAMEERRAAMLASRPASVLDGHRQDLYDAALSAAQGGRGVYRLSAPTGSGKTMSGLAFALAHAREHGMRRVVFGIPFTTITEQNAAVYRDLLGADVVLEHHSNVERDLASDQGRRAKLASENWDAAVVVTTTVQLLESLHANRPSKCRKLHRLANSVIVLDEVQSLPVHQLEPIAAMLAELVANFGVTVVLSTATQPPLEMISVFNDKLQAAGAGTIADVHTPSAEFSAAFKRVEYRGLGSVSLGDVAAELVGHDQALAVVNTTSDAAELFGLVRSAGPAWHLSTRMTAEHRARTLDAVRRTLAAGDPVRLISTQLIEAGVDVDFPVVIRALGPADSIVQAAGRANREGRRAVGLCLVADLVDGDMPPGAYRTAADETRRRFAADWQLLDDPSELAGYFAGVYRTLSVNRHEQGGCRTDKCVLCARAGLDYPETSRRFRMIDETTAAVVVPADKRPWLDSSQRRELERALDSLSGDRPARWALRVVRKHSASVPARKVGALTDAGLLSVVGGGSASICVWCGEYDRDSGVVLPSSELSVSGEETWVL